LNRNSLKKLLKEVSNGKLSVEKALEKLKDFPFEDIGFANIDHHRDLRRGLSEVIFGEGKEVRDIIEIMGRMIKKRISLLPVYRLKRQKRYKKNIQNLNITNGQEH
jgi:NCAIR mutase (PurE)-related protein